MIQEQNAMETEFKSFVRICIYMSAICAEIIQLTTLQPTVLRSHKSGLEL